MIQPMEAITTKKILLIDDDEIVRKLVQVCLENICDWQVTVASSGRKGLVAIAQAKPDVILLDMMMPDMDGFDFIEKLKTDDGIANIPVVAMTACTNFINHQSFIDLGCKDVISKPFDPITLGSRISRILGW